MGHLERLQMKKMSRLANIAERIRIFKNWYKIIFPFNHFFRGKQLLHLRNGKHAWVRDVFSSDLNVVKEVLGDNEYPLDFLKLPQHALIIDLGGNIGTFCMEMHQQFPEATLVAYEPFPQNVEMFKMNAPFVKVYQKAASAVTGTVQLEESNDFVGLRVIDTGGLTVPSESLEDILKDYEAVDLLKIDIEGSEYSLLNATPEKVFTKIKYILMETHTVPNFDDEKWAQDILSSHGFKVRWLDTGIVFGER